MEGTVEVVTGVPVDEISDTVAVVSDPVEVDPSVGVVNAGVVVEGVSSETCVVGVLVDD